MQAPHMTMDQSSNDGPSNTKSYSRFHAMAQKAGMSPQAYAKANLHTNGLVGTLARMYYIKSGVHGDGRSDMADAGDLRTKMTKLYQVG